MRDIEKVEQKLAKSAKLKQGVRDNLWYGVIGLASLITLVIFPMIGSDLPLQLILPDTAIGWIIYIFTKLAVAGLNMFIFHSFMQQGKQNVSGYWKKLMADEILHKVKQQKEVVPLSPEEWQAREYRNKGISLGITSVLGCVILSQVVLSFDVIIFISYILTLAIGLIFGLLQLGKSEQFWSLDYFDYAVYTLKQYNKEAPEDRQLVIRDKKLYEGAELIYEYN